MRSKPGAGDSLVNVLKDIVIVDEINCDNTLEKLRLSLDSMIKSRKYNIHVSSTEPYSPWQKKAENHIQIIKGIAHRRVAKRWVPKCLWGFVLVWKSGIYCHTASSDGQIGMEIMTDNTPDISDWTNVEFYDLVWYWHRVDDESRPNIGRWLGLSHTYVSTINYFILTI